MQRFPRITLLALATALACATPLAASAAGLGLNIGVRADAHIGSSTNASTTVHADVSENLWTRAVDRADQEIQRRMGNLMQLIDRLGTMKRLSSDDQASLDASLQAQISELTALKAKIDADIATTSLKTDVQSITKSYRTYMLVLPQARIAATADRIQTIIAQFKNFSLKLQDRITAASSAGTDVSAAQSAYADMQAKIIDAGAQVSAAVSETANLAPDNGDATVAASNQAALKDARTKIQAATADLKAARKDIGVILGAIKGASAEAHASGNASASTTGQ